MSTQAPQPVHAPTPTEGELPPGKYGNVTVLPPAVLIDATPGAATWRVESDGVRSPAPVPFYIHKLPKTAFVAALPALPWCERDLLERLYLRGQQFSEVAAEVKVPVQRLLEIHYSATSHLRAELRKQPPAG